MEYSMRKVRIESHSHHLIVGFLAGVEWVNDSAVTIVDLDDRGRTPFVSWRTGMDPVRRRR